MNNNSVIAVLVVAVIVLAAWFAYQQGLFRGKDDNSSDIEINLPGSQPTPTPRY